MPSNIVNLLQAPRDYEDKQETQVLTVMQDLEDPREIQDLVDQKAMQVSVKSDQIPLQTGKITKKDVRNGIMMKKKCMA